jgi:YihY family inner membrane protein
VNPIQHQVRRFDAFQRGHRWLALPVAVAKTFGDDQAGNLAALIAYFGFLCLIPLLMVAVTVLGEVTAHDPAIRQRLLHSALRDFPVIGPQIGADVHGIQGSGLTLIVGLVLTLWSGLGVAKAFQAAMNTVWKVPFRRRPGLLPSTVRAVLMLVVLGLATIASAALAAIGTSGSAAAWLAAVGFAGAALINVGLFMGGFRILTAADVSWSDVAPGAVLGGIAWTVLCSLGTYYVSHQLRNASTVYGTFAGVIVLLAWLYLGAQVALYAAELNVVRRDRLYPRSLVQSPLTEGDREALRRYSKQEERQPEEDVDLTFRAGDRSSRP